MSAGNISLLLLCFYYIKCRMLRGVADEQKTEVSAWIHLFAAS